MRGGISDLNVSILVSKENDGTGLTWKSRLSMVHEIHRVEGMSDHICTSFNAFETTFESHRRVAHGHMDSIFLGEDIYVPQNPR